MNYFYKKNDMKAGFAQKETVELVRFFWNNQLAEEEYVYHVSNYIRKLITGTADRAVERYRLSFSRAREVVKKQNKRFVQKSIEEIEDYIYEKE